MTIITDIADIDCIPSSIVTVGTFDGLHLGHQEILKLLGERSSAMCSPSTLVTFYPHPREVLTGETVPRLTSRDERIVLLKRHGIDRFVVLPFSSELAALSGEEFVRDVLLAKVGMQHIVTGHDHVFGRKRSGNSDLLQKLGSELHFGVSVAPAISSSGVTVSSTGIRRLLSKDGNVLAASEQLGYRYSLRGRVVRGARRGHTIGYPTANLEPLDPRKVVPLNGVYAVTVSVGEQSDRHVGMMNIGTRPTFENKGIHIEVHILDFEADLYDCELHVEFVSRIRSEQKFADVQTLIMQLNEDRKRCNSLVQKLMYTER
jgi:riboflavin kinase / FMN adenylyltransferase